MSKNALIIGIRNEKSLSYEIAKELIKKNYSVYATYQDESTLKSVKEAADELGIKAIYQYDARKDSDLESFTDALKKSGVKLDVLVHGIAYSSTPGAKLNQLLMNISGDEFTDAIRIGAFSLLEVIGKLYENINENASILALTSRWSRVAVPGFNVIGAAKASLESIVRGLAEDLGRLKQIKVNALSSGPVSTTALSSLGNSLSILEAVRTRSPLKRNVSKEDVASLAMALIENNSISGTIYQIDTGLEIMGV
ncbi:MAG TPA: hypothetical protein DHW82_04360 [Spirochaetia bacterium]|nr:MAG: hypothetical protein A2Y41_02055 [Spirochaetes bacterium GWB1_36_13]HCL56227.1 hypothetical protein [Spirochaetia bacterium]